MMLASVPFMPFSNSRRSTSLSVSPGWRIASIRANVSSLIGMVTEPSALWVTTVGSIDDGSLSLMCTPFAWWPRIPRGTAPAL